MVAYDQEWCDGLVAAVDEGASQLEPLRLLYVVTDTADGKVAFNLEFEDGGGVVATAGKLPRGQKADVTVTVKEPIAMQLWAGEERRDVAFMRGDIKVEGVYHRWLDELVPMFESEPWKSAWAYAA